MGLYRKRALSGSGLARSVGYCHLRRISTGGQPLLRLNGIGLVGTVRREGSAARFVEFKALRALLVEGHRGDFNRRAEACDLDRSRFRPCIVLERRVKVLRCHFDLVRVSLKRGCNGHGEGGHGKRARFVRSAKLDLDLGIARFRGGNGADEIPPVRCDRQGHGLAVIVSVLKRALAHRDAAVFRVRKRDGGHSRRNEGLPVKLRDILSGELSAVSRRIIVRLEGLLEDNGIIGILLCAEAVGRIQPAKVKLIKVQSPASAVNGHVAAVEVEIAVDFHDVVGLRSRKAEVTAVYGKLINSKGSVITRLHIQCSGGLSRALSVDRKASVPLVPDRAAGVCGCGQRLPVNEDYAHVAVYAEGAVIGHVAADDVPSRGISARAEDGIAAPHKYLEILAELFFSVFVQVFIPVAYREVKRSSSAVRVYAVDRHGIYSGVLHGIGVYELVVISALYKLLSVSRLDGICGRYLLARVFIKPLARYGGIVRKIVDEILAAYELKLRKLNGVALPAAVELKAEIFICVGVSYGKSIRGRALRLQNGVVLNVCKQSP